MRRGGLYTNKRVPGTSQRPEERCEGGKLRPLRGYVCTKRAIRLIHGTSVQCQSYYGESPPASSSSSTVQNASPSDSEFHIMLDALVSSSNLSQ